MTSNAGWDLIDFEELYPGSKRTRRSADAPKPVSMREPTNWDSRPYIKLVGGQPQELFAIGALAAALGRPLVTVRLWINQGKLPQATYRLPSREVSVYGPDGQVRSTKQQKGRRLYTRAQIEAVIRIATEHDILLSPRIDWTKHQDFSLHVAEAWQQLDT